MVMVVVVEHFFASGVGGVWSRMFLFETFLATALLKNSMRKK